MTDLFPRKIHERYDEETFSPDERGTQFMSEVGHFDLKDVHILHAGVDTIRQLFKGSCKREWVDLFERLREEGEQKPVVVIREDEFVLGHGGKSGYRYRLQNNELGIIMFFGSRYCETDEVFSHLKIECSPHWIESRSISNAQCDLSGYASYLLSFMETAGVAVHLAVDVKGWELPDDFENRLVTRSKRRSMHLGMESVELVGGEACQVYGDRESFLFGSAASCQFAVYDKTKEAHKRDKLDYWESIWRRKGRELDEPYYQEGDRVFRLELRFHHSVIGQMHFDGKSVTCIGELEEYLHKVYEYGLNVFRLDLSRTYVDPMWQLLAEDVQFGNHFPAMLVKRIYKTPARGSERNIGLMLGNMVTLYARNGHSAKALYDYLQRSEIFMEVKKYYRDRDRDLYQHLEKEIALRRLVGKAA